MDVLAGKGHGPEPPHGPLKRCWERRGTVRDRVIDTFDTNDYEEFQFDERLTLLADLIGSLNRPGDYCVQGRRFAPMPRVKVGTIGTLSFPIPPAQVEALITEAERAPYGRGQDTIVDRSVRDCWQIAADRVDVAGGAWAGTFGDILRLTTEGLGCPADAVSAVLYKLLIYEPGGFFAPHRDTEKADGMVATLVISLPTAGAGGELAIRHRGRETIVDTRSEEPSELIHAAFYADCEHEIRPVTEGHRVCLVYNLLLTGDKAIPTEAPDYAAEVAAIATELEARCREPGTSGKLVWVLEHDYSEAGLSFGTLKNVDAAIGRVLAAAAERADCALHAAILHVEEYGTAWYDGYAREVESIEDDEYELVEIVDFDFWLEGWVHPDGATADYGALPLMPGELMPAGRLDGERPDSQRLTEASGNEGATIERLYRRAALVVWPKSDSVRVLAGAGAGALAAFLAAEWRRERAGGPTCGAVAETAAQVSRSWPAPHPHETRTGRDRWLRQSAEALELLGAIGNRAATMRFLENVVLPHYGAPMNDALLGIAADTGPKAFRNILDRLVRRNLARRTDGILDLAHRLCERLDDGSDTAWPETLRIAVLAVRSTLPLLGSPPDDDTTALSVASLATIFRLVWRYDLADEADEVAAFVIERPDLASPDRTVPALLAALRAEHGNRVRESAAFVALWHHGAGYLLSRSGSPPEPPADWTVPTDALACDCPHCAELRRFCADPEAEIRRIPLRKELRRHLRQEIASSGIDMLCETERQGRPFTLICIKTRASHERRLRQYDEDIAEIGRLIGLAEAVPDSGRITESLRTAAERSSA